MTSMSCRRGEDARGFYMFSRKRNSFFLSTTIGDCERLNNVGQVQASDRIRYHLQLCVKRVRLLRNLGQKFSFHKHAADGKEGKEGTWKGRFRLLISIPIVIIVLILFSALFLVSIRRILCQPGYSLLPGSFPPGWATTVFQNQHLKDSDSKSWCVFSHPLVTCKPKDQSCNILFWVFEGLNRSISYMYYLF